MDASLAAFDSGAFGADVVATLRSLAQVVNEWMQLRPALALQHMAAGVAVRSS
jgi:hypothetical protein